MKYFIDIAFAILDVFLIIKLFEPSNNPGSIDDEQKKIIKGFGKKLLIFVIFASLIIILINHENEIMSFIQNNINQI